MTLEQRLSRLEAIEAIKQLKARYFHACDRKESAAVRDCFWSLMSVKQKGRKPC